MIRVPCCIFSVQRLVTVRALCEVEAPLRGYVKLFGLSIVQNNRVIMPTESVTTGASTYEEAALTARLADWLYRGQLTWWYSQLENHILPLP